MNKTNTQASPRLVVRRKIAAPQARVFAAWTQPDQMRRWAGPGEVTATEVEVDLRVGGKYRITMLMPDGEKWYVGGVYREIQEPQRVVYTWKWEEGAPEQEIETLITVEFNSLAGDETELVLTHEGFASEESRNNHEGGWNQAVDQFARIVV